MKLGQSNKILIACYKAFLIFLAQSLCMLCLSKGCTNLVYITFEIGGRAANPPWLYVISALNHLMLMVNSSINFIIYCAVGSKFRRAVMEKICPKFWHSSTRSRPVSNGIADPLPMDENNLVRIYLLHLFFE